MALGVGGTPDDFDGLSHPHPTPSMTYHPRPYRCLLLLLGGLLLRGCQEAVTANYRR